MAEPAETVSRDDAFAVLIGVGRYDFPEIPPLQHAVDDAKALHEALVDKVRGNFSDKNVKLLIEPDTTTLLAIKRAISRWLHERTRDKPRARVVIFFAGHGDCELDLSNQEPDGYAKYLLARDSDPSDLFNTALSNEEFTRLLKTIQAERMVIFLDACFSGAVAGARGVGARGPGQPGDLSEDMLKKLAPGAPRVIIAAAKSDQRSYEHASLGHGIFTHHLLEVLAGKADSDNDGFTWVRDVFEYLRKSVPKTAEVRCGERQQPVMRPDEKDFEDFPLLAHPARLAEILHERRTDTLTDLLRKDQVTRQEYDDLSGVLKAKLPLGKDRVADWLYELLDGHKTVEAFRAGRQAFREAQASSYGRGQFVEALPSAPAASQRPESPGEQDASYPQELGTRQASQEEKDEAQIAPRRPATWASIGRVMKASIQIALGLALMGFMVYATFYDLTVDLVVQDIEWEPNHPGVGDRVRFTAKFLVAYKVRKVGRLPWSPQDFVEGETLAATFTETWSVGDEKQTTKPGLVFQSGEVQEARFETAFRKPGTYPVRFEIDGTISDSERNNNSFTRIITVVAASRNGDKGLDASEASGTNAQMLRPPKEASQR